LSRAVFGKAEGNPAVVAVRADIDALPMPEENDLPYRSGARA
jgi:metal-dependent amidase/aminoacylase/carboxypeptidase family protein